MCERICDLLLCITQTHENNVALEKCLYHLSRDVSIKPYGTCMITERYIFIINNDAFTIKFASPLLNDILRNVDPILLLLSILFVSLFVTCF